MPDNASVTVSAAPEEFNNAPAIPMPDNNAVIGQMIFEKAKSQYPYLADKDISFDYAPGKGRGFLEFIALRKRVLQNTQDHKTFHWAKWGFKFLTPKLDLLIYWLIM